MTYDYDRRLATRPIPVDKPALAALARDLVRELPKHLKFRPEDMDAPLSRARGFTSNWGFGLGVYETTDVEGGYVAVPITVGWANLEEWSPTRQWIAGGGVTSRYFGPRGKGSKIGLSININASRTPNEILSHLARVEKEAFSVFIHETTHLRDILKDVEHYQKAKETAPSYYNEPTEVRAFMQQIADEALEYAEDQAKSIGVGTWGITLSSRFLERALELSITWNRVKRELTPANEKLILKGVERALRDEWPRLEKQYPAESVDDE